MVKTLNIAGGTLANAPTIAAAAQQIVPAVSNALPALKPITLSELSSFGTKASGMSAAVTDKITGIAKTSDMDEIGALLQNTLKTAKGYDPESLKKKGFLGLFKAKFSDFKSRFDTVDDSMKQLIAQIDHRVRLFSSRIADLETLQKNNRAAHDQLIVEIEAMHQRIQWMEANVPDVDLNDPFSAQQKQDWLMVVGLATKRADDLARLKLLFQQQDAQITQMKQNSAGLATKFSDVRDTTVPALKQSFTLYVLQIEQEKGAEFADVVDNTTNAVIQANAQKLGQTTTAIHTALTRSNISVDTLKANHDSIITSLNEVERIHTEMKLRLTTEAPQLEQLSRDLSARLAK